MAYVTSTGRTTERPELGVSFFFQNPCTSESDHAYAEKICPKCGRDFCFDCCASTNVDQGGKHEKDYMLCPECGHDIYSEE